MTAAWGGRAPATWNCRVATVRSFLASCQRRRWLAEDLTVDLKRRPELADHTKAIPLAELQRLWRRDDVGSARRRCGGCCTRPLPVPVRMMAGTRGVRQPESVTAAA
jgi:hypothetical protein